MLAALLLALIARAGAASDAPVPLRTAPGEAWSFTGLVLEGPPLAHGAHVIVHGREASGRRALAVLEAASGRVLARTLFQVATPLDPVLCGERVVVRAGEARLELLRWRAVRFVSERSFLGTAPLSRPACDGDELYLREGETLVRFDLGRREPLWRSAPELRMRGTPALHGEDVLALAYDARGTCVLARLARRDGRLLATTALGAHADGVPPVTAEARIFPHATQTFVELPAPVLGRSGDGYRWTLVPAGDAEGGPTLHHFLAEPLALEDGWLAPVTDPEGGARWVSMPDGRELASSTHHAWLARASAPAARAGEVLYLGPCAADANTFAVLWRRATVPDFAPVPHGEALLVIEAGVLRSLIAPRPPPTPAEGAARAKRRAAEAALAQRLLELAGRALRARDAELARRWIEEAETLGAQGRALDVVRAELERVLSAPALQPDARKLALLRGEEERARGARLERLLDDARRARGEEALLLLEESLRLAPTHPDALIALAARLPAGASLLPEQALSWLAYLHAAQELPLELVTSPGDPRATGTRLATERQGWREDALLYTSPGIALVTAGAPPAAVAEALATGERVSAFLERVFGPPRARAQRLDVVLYPDRASYLDAKGSDGEALESTLGWTAGHFDPAANVSRLFVPESGLSEGRLAEVQAHELTHHWLDARSSAGPVRATAETAGYWIVEGIALWVEERDLTAGVLGTRRAQADTLDTLAAPGAPLLPWRDVLGFSQERSRTLETRPTAELPLAWRLGARTPRSPMHLFYAQSGALAHWLWEADGGSRRELLLEAVRAYQAGTPLDLVHATGLSAEELGARVLAFARVAIEP